MVIRFHGGDIGRSFNVQESVYLAKQAVQLDLSDGYSWYVLGNAHMTNFFTSSNTISELELALKAYTQATTYSTNPNPDLHYNKATTLKLLERYNQAMLEYSKAHALDPMLGAEHEQVKLNELMTKLEHALKTSRKHP